MDLSQKQKKTRNRAVVARFRARRAKWQWRTMRRGGMVVHTRWWWWWGGAFAKREAGDGVWAKNAKPSCCGSVSDAPCEMAMENVAWGWDGGAYEVVVVVGWRIRETRGGGWDLSQKYETEPLCSVSGAPCETTMEEGAQGCGGGAHKVAAAEVVVVGLCVRETRWGWLWAKIPQLSRRGSVSGCILAAIDGEGGCGVMAPPPVLT